MLAANGGLRWWRLAMSASTLLLLLPGPSGVRVSLAQTPGDVQIFLERQNAILQTDKDLVLTQVPEEVVGELLTEEEGSEEAAALALLRPNDDFPFTASVPLIPPVETPLSTNSLSSPVEDAEKALVDDINGDPLEPQQQDEAAVLYDEPEISTPALPFYSARGRILGGNSGGRLHRVMKRLAIMGHYKFHPQEQEAPGQLYVAKIVAKTKMFLRWKEAHNIVHCCHGPHDPEEEEDYIALTNETQTKQVKFLRQLQTTRAFVDMLVRQKNGKKWIGRLYRQIDGEENAADNLEKDFELLSYAPSGESIKHFRHRMRLDIPIELYGFEDSGSFVESPEDKIYLNAVARRPLIRINAEQLPEKVRREQKGKKALLGISQQAVLDVSNLNCLGVVHTNINPGVLLLNQRGLVFLGGLDQAKKEGEVLPRPLQINPGYTPPEFEVAYCEHKASFKQDAWQLGMTLYRLWCEDAPSTGPLNFTGCSPLLPQEMKDMISAFTAVDQDERLTAQEAASSHPAMFLPITKGKGQAPLVEIDPDDGDDEAE